MDKHRGAHGGDYVLVCAGLYLLSLFLNFFWHQFLNFSVTVQRRWVKPVDAAGKLIGGPGQHPVDPPIPRVVKLDEWILAESSRLAASSRTADKTGASSSRARSRSSSRTAAAAARRRPNATL